MELRQVLRIALGLAAALRELQVQVQLNLSHGCTSDLERLPEDQPREHPHQGIPGNRVIDLVQFADDSAIDRMYIDRAYYLAPDGKMAGDAFAMMHEGMKGKVGSGSLPSTAASTSSPCGRRSAAS
jgi:hypothetical protein